MKFDRIFNGAILATLHLINLNMIDFKMLFEEVSSSKRNISHLIKVFGGLFPEPFINLFRSKGLIANADKELLNFF